MLLLGMLLEFLLGFLLALLLGLLMGVLLEGLGLQNRFEIVGPAAGALLELLALLLGLLLGHMRNWVFGRRASDSMISYCSTGCIASFRKHKNANVYQSGTTWLKTFQLCLLGCACQDGQQSGCSLHAI